MPPESSDHQNGFLNAARKQRRRVHIFLINGIKLTGLIKSFDQFVVMLSMDHGSQIMYKRAISTVQLDTGLAATRREDVERDTGSKMGRRPSTNGRSHGGGAHVAATPFRRYN